MASLAFINILFIFIAVVIIIFSLLSSVRSSRILLLHMNFAEITNTYIFVFVVIYNVAEDIVRKLANSLVCMYLLSNIYVCICIIFVSMKMDMQASVHFVIVVAAVI